METAYLVPADEVEPLVDGLIWHVEEKEAARLIGKRAHDFVLRRLSPQTMLDETLDFYKEEYPRIHALQLN